MFLLFAAFFSLFLLRLYSILPRYKWPVKRAQFDTVALAVFLGSGKCYWNATAMTMTALFKGDIPPRF
jgi:hypothetical protein